MSTAPPSSIASPEMPKRRQTGKSGATGSRGKSGPSNSEAIIALRIQEAQTALWRAELSRSLLVVVVATLVGITLWSVMDHWIWSPGKLVRSIALLSGIGAVVGWVTKRVLPLFKQTVLPEYAAHSLEHDLPELRHSLTSYVSLRDDQNREGVRGIVVRSIGARAAGQLQDHEIEVPSEANTNLYWWLGVAAAIAMAAGYALFSPKDAIQSTKRLLMPLATIDAPHRVQITDVTPGDTEVLAGRPFEVSAMIEGLPNGAKVRVEYGTDFINAKTLELSSETRRHQTMIVVDGSTSYRIAGGDAIAGPFEIRTRNVPVVNIEHVHLTPPAYTKLAPRQSRGGAIVGEENSMVTIRGSLNLPIKRARIEFNPRQVGERIQSTGGVLDMRILPGGLGVEASFPLRLPDTGSGAVTLESYRLHVWDMAEVDNPEPIVYPIRIIADLKPEIAITTPQTPLSEVPVNGAQRLEIRSLDPDYGLKQIDLKITRGVHKVATETIWSSEAGERGNQNAAWVLQPDALGLRVGETIQVVAIASDNRHDASGALKPNIVASDPIELKIIARQENSRPSLQDQPNEKPQDGNESGSDDGKQPADGKGQQGQGGSGQGQQGQGGQGESAEPQKGQEGQKGQGQSGESKEDQSGDGQTEGNSSGGASGKGTKEPNGNNEQRDMNASPPQDGQQPPSDSPAPQDGKPGSDAGTGPGSPQAGDNNKEMDPSEARGDQNAEGQNAEGQNAAGKQGNSQDPKTGASQKPQHDGDAFERIRDFLKDNKNNEPSGEGKPKEPNQPSEGQSGTGENNDGGSEAGKPKTGEPSPGNGKSSDGKPSAKSETGTNGAEGSDGKKKDDSAKPDSEAGENGAGENGASGQSPKDEESKTSPDTMKPDSGEPGTPSDQGDSKPQTEKSGTSTQDDDQNASGESDSNSPAKQQSGQENPSKGGKPTSDSSDETPKSSDGRSDEGKTGEGKNREGKNGEGEEKSGENGEGQPASKKANSEGKPGERPEQPGQPGNESGEQNGSDSSQPPANNDGNSGTTGGGDAGDGKGSDSQELAAPPDPVNLEEAKKATEMVLEYLDRQRETPDPELLKQLDWTPDELRDFADRWNRIRDLEKTGTADKTTVEDALRSLGIRENQTGPMGKTSDTDDSLRTLRDGGNRVPAPKIHQDAFESFRRNVNRERTVPK